VTQTLTTLPATGTPLVPLIAAALVLLLVGALLLFWQ
jgi:LPXTG-motif cell wall-anchored protein